MKPVYSKHAPEPIGPYSQAIESGHYVFCSGQVAIDPQRGELVAGDVAAQASRALNNLLEVLKAAGLSAADVVKTTVFLIDMNDFTAVNGAYATFFGDAKPARSTVAVSGLPLGARVEIDAIAKKA